MLNYKKLVKRINLKSFPLPLSLSVEDNYLNVTMDVKCRNTGKALYLHARRRLLDTDDKNEALRYLYWNVQEAVLHELGECFLYKKGRLFDPHENEKGRQLMLMGPPDESWLTRGAPDEG